MAGILIGTSATYVIQFILKIILFYKRFLKINCFAIFAKNTIYAAVTAAECAAVIFAATDEFRYVFDFVRGFISKREKNS